LQFSHILKASSFPMDAQICVKRVIFMPRPLILFTWDGWWTDMKCSLVGPSSLFQRWNTQVRKNYGLLNEKFSKAEDKIRVLVIKRTTRSSASMYTSRVIANLDEVEASLKEISNAELIVQDLGGMNLEEQVKLIASVGIVVGVHGAGIPNSMHMSIGSEHCCGVIEIFPQGEFSAIRGYGNMVRRMGINYQRMDLGSKESQSSGAIVTASLLKSEVEKMIDAILHKPSCILPSVLEDPYFDSVSSMINHPTR
jgi:capsular polysaccharide biosynthesis protein